MKFKVRYSTEKDIENYLNSAWRFSYEKHGRFNMEEKVIHRHPKEFKKELRQAKTKEIAYKVVKKFLTSLPQSFKETTEKLAFEAEKELNQKSDEIVKELETVYEETFPFDQITVYLTTCNINPYNFNEKWFMGNRNASIEQHLKTAKHELNHFMFYFYYPHLKKELGEKPFERLKEALTVFTNSEGSGKPEVKKLEGLFLSLPNKSIKEAVNFVLKNKDSNILTEVSN